MSSSTDIQFENDALPIGAGAWGVIYRAYDTRLKRNVAVKFFDGTSDREIEQIQRHVKALVAVDHPNVVKVWGLHDLVRPDSVPDGKQPAIVMEFVPGLTLKDWLSKGPHDAIQCEQICRQILNGIRAIHSVDHIHADLHSKNVLIFGDQAKIIDPAASTTTAIFTTRIREDSKTFDVRSTLDLIRSVMDCCEDKELSRRFYRYSFGNLATIDDLIIHFESIVNNTSNLDSGPAPTHAMAFSDGNRSVQDALIAQALESQVKAFEDLKDELNRPFEDIDDVSDALIEGLTRLSPSHSVLYSAAASASETSQRNALKILRRMTFAPWPQSGLTVYCHMPYGLAYIACHVTGAIAIQAGNVSFLRELFSLRFRSLYEPASTFLEQDELAGWPHSLGRNCNMAWDKLVNLHSRYRAIDPFFRSDSDYRSSLCAFSMISCFIAYCKYNRGRQDERVRFPPMYCITHSKWHDYVIASMLDLCEDSSGLTDMMFGIIGERPDSLLECWNDFIRFSRDFLSKGSAWGMRFPSMLEDYPWPPPSDPFSPRVR